MNFSAMADEFDDAIDGRLVIATDDERMDCTEVAILSNEHKESGSSAAEQDDTHKGTTGKKAETMTDGCPCHQENDGQNCWKDEHSLVASNNSLEFKGNANEATENIAVGLDRVQKIPSADLVKWEELGGGVVPPSESKFLENERGLQGVDLETKGHFANESNKPTTATPLSHNQQSGVHNFLCRGADSKKKKLMLDKGTCVLSRHTGVSVLDEHLLAMRPGTNLTIDITIICKAGSNTLYISAKWKGREYHGVLTDGEPLFSHTYAQKRSAAQNAEKFVFESGTGNNGSPANQKAQNPEKAVGGGLSGKRGGKRGVGGHPKGAGGEKRAKTQPTECQIGGGDAEDEAVRQSKSEDKVRTDAHDEVAERAELGTTAGRHQTEEKSSAHPHGHCQQQHHRRRRTSSSASSGVCALTGKSGLYDGDAVSRIRCPHQQCGHRFETAHELNTHLLVGAHGVAGTKAKIFESIASQTPPVQLVSVGCDPCFSSTRPVSKGILFCAKCQKELAPEEGGEGPSDEVIRPQLLECDENGEKSKQKGATDNSPGFSDISDDAAPTLEKEESFDKQNDEAKKGVPPTPAASSDATLNRTDAGDPSAAAASPPHQQNADTTVKNDPSDPPNVIGTTSKSAASVSIVRQNLPSALTAKTKTAEESAANGATKPVKKTSSSSSAMPTMAKTPISTENLSEPNNSNGTTYLMAPTSEMTAANAVASAFPFNHFLPFGPHLSQAFASALAQGTVPIGVVPSSAPSASSLGPSSSALSAGLKLMSPPSAAGLLSLGTPLAASASQMPNCSGAPSKSAEPPPISQPIQHKIYELQQQQSGALLGRSSSTKPSTINMGHAQSVSVGTPLGGASNASSSSVDMALMRPNSAISAVGHHALQQSSNSQLHSSGAQMLPQSSRQGPPGAPSPVGSSIGAGGVAGSAVHHLPAPPLHHTFFPPLSMLAGAGAQFGIPAGSAAAAPNLLAAAAQQHQQQMAAAALRNRNNSAYVGQSGPSTHQQQQAVAAAQHPNASLIPPFVPQGLSPGMLAAASNFDLNALQHYAAALLASSADGLGNAPPVGQQHQPNQK